MILGQECILSFWVTYEHRGIAQLESRAIPRCAPVSVLAASLFVFRVNVTLNAESHLLAELFLPARNAAFRASEVSGKCQTGCK